MFIIQIGPCDGNDNKNTVKNISFEPDHCDGPFVSGSILQETINYLKENGFDEKNKPGFLPSEDRFFTKN